MAATMSARSMGMGIDAAPHRCVAVAVRADQDEIRNPALSKRFSDAAGVGHVPVEDHHQPAGARCQNRREGVLGIVMRTGNGRPVMLEGVCQRLAHQAVGVDDKEVAAGHGASLGHRMAACEGTTG